MGSTTPPSVGFVGLGTMGGPIAERLRSAGVPLVLHNRDRTKAEPLLAGGAVWAASPKEVARQASSAVLVMVSDARAVRAVVLGRRGVVAGAHDGTLVVNLSTIAPEESRAVAEKLAARGVRYLEAPVGGSRDAARAGELLVFAGGDAADLARVRPLLERFAARIEHVGPVGAGAAMKLANNLVTVATVAVDAEALVFAEALGVAPARALELLRAGGGESRMLAAKADAFLRREYPEQFKLALAVKDLKLISRAAREAGTRTPLAREAQRLADEAMKAGDGPKDFAVLYEAARRRREPGAPAPPAPAAATPSPPSDGTSGPPSAA